ncbi:MAG: universal stress protein [Deltaproteobacteria bacterium]|nr:universal stress protein [Deltaproteobacteria bacterium]
MRVNIKNILCATDFSDLSDQAVLYGIALARVFGAKFYLCHVIDLTSSAIYGESILNFDSQLNRVRNYAHAHLKQLIGDLDVEWEPLITIGHAAEEIAHIAEEKDVDMVISATHSRKGLKRFFLGSVTQRLMRTVPCPLLIVRSTEPEFMVSRDRELKIRKILVGCDFSPDSGLAVQYALSLAQEFQSELHLVHVIEPEKYKNLLKPATDAGKRANEDLRDQLSDKLNNIIPEEAYHWCSPKTALLAGEPQEELTKYAVVQKMDLMVLGLRGHNLMESLFIGSTTVRVSYQVPCPVLSVRPTEEGERE